MKINHFICPDCGHDFYTDCAYGRCDACQTVFYAASSKTSKPQEIGTIKFSGAVKPTVK